MTDRFEHYFSKKMFSRFIYCSIFGFLFVVVSTLSFYWENSLMFGCGEKDDLQFLRVTSYKFSALNSVMSKIV